MALYHVGPRFLQELYFLKNEEENRVVISVSHVRLVVFYNLTASAKSNSTFQYFSNKNASNVTKVIHMEEKVGALSTLQTYFLATRWHC